MSQMHRSRTGSARSRGAALLLAAFVLVAGLTFQLGRLTVGAWAQMQAPGPTLPDEALGLLAGVVATGVAAWLLSALAVSTVAALSTRSRIAAPVSRTAQRLAPTAVRNAVAALLGVALIATPVAAQAASVPVQSISQVQVYSPQLTTAPSVDAARPGWADVPGPTGRNKLLQTLSPGWTPERPRPTAATSPTPEVDLGVLTPTPRRPAGADDPIRHHVVVLQGDTLWSIAARHLGSSATDAEIAREWPRWYRINRHLIGADPHRLLPGERLRSPDVTTVRSELKETAR